MEWFVAVVIVAALGVAAVAAAGGLGEMTKDPVRDVYRQDLPDDRPLSAADITGLRFGLALRGYAMDQVDDILDRVSREIAERDELIARLRASQGSADEQPGSIEAAPVAGWSPSTYGTAAARDVPDEVSTEPG